MKENNFKNGSTNTKEPELDVIVNYHNPKHHILSRGRGITSEKWVQQVFNTKTAMEGGVCRRKLSSIDKFASRPWIFDEATKRGFDVIHVGEQWVFINRRFHFVQQTDSCYLGVTDKGLSTFLPKQGETSDRADSSR
jgi:hypothetical protein